MNILDFSHSTGVLHGAVLPTHVLIEPKEHKLLLIDWCFAVLDIPRIEDEEHAVDGESYRPWFSRDGIRRPPTRSLDISLRRKRCIIELVGGDASHGVSISTPG